ncbi:MAG: hypothetical protein ACI4J5_00070 [Oscillospiraceae bacterium]
MDRAFLILDIIAAAILICGTINGVHKGFLKTVLTLAVYLLAVIGAAVISGPLSAQLYDEYCKEAIISAAEKTIINTEDRLKNALSEAVSEEIYSEAEKITDSISQQDLTNPEISDKLNSVLEPVFDSFRYELDDSMPVTVSDDMVYDDMKTDLFRFIAEDDTRAAAEYIEETTVRSIVVKVIEYVLWTVSFIVISIVGKAVVRAVLAVRKIELVRSADRLLGGVLGLLGALLLLSAVVVIVKLVIGITGGIGFLSEEAAQNTVLFKYIYNLFDI